MMADQVTPEEFAAAKLAAGITPKDETILKIIGIMLRHKITLADLRSHIDGSAWKDEATAQRYRAVLSEHELP
jgi:hypothetical protein